MYLLEAAQHRCQAWTDVEDLDAQPGPGIPEIERADDVDPVTIAGLIVELSADRCPGHGLDAGVPIIEAHPQVSPPDDGFAHRGIQQEAGSKATLQQYAHGFIQFADAVAGQPLASIWSEPEAKARETVLWLRPEGLIQCFRPR